MSIRCQAPEHVPRDHEAPEPVRVDRAANAPYTFPERSKAAMIYSRLVPDADDSTGRMAHASHIDLPGGRKKAGIFGFLRQPEAEAHRRKRGLRPWLFWTLIVVGGLILIGASVGGAVGGVQALKNNTGATTTNSNLATTIAAPAPPSSTTATTVTTATTATTTSTSSPATPTVSYACSDGLKYSPESRAGGVAGAYTLQEHCETNISDGSDLAQATVGTFELCMQTCTYWNEIWGGVAGMPTCTGVVFNAGGSCWAKNGTTLTSNPTVRNGASALVVSGLT